MTHARIASGCRRLTEAHLHVHAMAQCFEGLPEGVSKGQVLSAFKQAACTLGISPRLRDAVDVLFAFSQAQDWEEGSRPVVWPSNRKLESALSLGRRQVQNVLNSLIHLRLITPVDSPTGKRWGKREATTGKINEAYGFDLSPIGFRYREFVEASKRAAGEERERAVLRRRLTIVRKAIGQIGETAIEYQLTERDWQGWLDEASALVRRVQDDCPLRDTQEAVERLEEWRLEGEAELRKALESVENSVKISPSEAENCTLTTSTTHPSADKSATGRNGPGGRRSGGGDSPTSSDPDVQKRSEQEPSSITPRFVLNVSPELKSYISTDLPNWSDIVEAAYKLRQELGISRAAWIDACQTMGRYQAATAVAVIAAKGDTIHSPGGYLRGMTGRAGAGELHLNKSLWGIARRECSPERV